jgi:hypothetical protein
VTQEAKVDCGTFKESTHTDYGEPSQKGYKTLMDQIFKINCTEIMKLLPNTKRCDITQLSYCLLSWRRIAVASYIKRLPSNENAVHIDRFRHFKNCVHLHSNKTGDEKEEEEARKNERISYHM